MYRFSYSKEEQFVYISLHKQMVLTFNLEDSVVGEMKNRGSRISYLLKPYTVKTHLTVTPSLPLTSKRVGAQLTRNWWKWVRRVWKYLVEKRALRQNEGLCREMEGCHIILRSFLRFLMMQHRKKTLMCLSFLC